MHFENYQVTLIFLIDTGDILFSGNIGYWGQIQHIVKEVI